MVFCRRHFLVLWPWDWFSSEGEALESKDIGGPGVSSSNSDNNAERILQMESEQLASNKICFGVCLYVRVKLNPLSQQEEANNPPFSISFFFGD